MKTQIDLVYPRLELGYQRFDCPQSGLEVSVSAKLNKQSPPGMIEKFGAEVDLDRDLKFPLK